MSEAEGRLVMAQLLLTLDFMEKKSIIHRDLKPENIMFNSSANGVLDIRLADFGYSTHTSDINNQLYLCGTPGYIAPEVIEGKVCTHKSDIFSAGAILFSMLALTNLFSGRDNTEILNHNKQCNVAVHVRYWLKSYSQNLRGFVLSLLQADPDNRPSAAEALADPWFFDEQIAL